MSILWRLRLRDLVQDRVGIVMRTDGASSSMERFVDARVLGLGLSDRMAYVRYLEEDGEEGAEFRRVISVVAIGQTYFFRDQEQFAAIGGLLTERAKQKGGTLHIWSAACSTGQEPYSLVMLCDHLGLNARVLGTDVNEQAIEASEAGHYVEWTIRNVPVEMRTQYFTKRQGQYVVNDFLRRRVHFKRHNVVRQGPCSPPSGNGWDLILCRHAMVYFSQATIEQTARNLAANLGEQGRIFLGASESLHGFNVPLVAERVGKRIAYRRAEPTDLRPLDPPLRRLPSGADIRPEKGSRSLPPTVEVARAKTADGRFREALEIMNDVVAAPGADEQTWLLLGHLKLQLHDFPGALEAYVQAQAHDALLPEAHYLQGVVHRKLGDLENAVVSLRRCLFLEPDFWPASFLLAGVYDRLGRREDRRRQLSRTIAVIDSEVKDLFLVPIDPIPTLALPAADVARQCRRQLSTR